MAVIEPADVDWSEADDAEVWHASTLGIPEAEAEAKRRHLDKPAAEDDDDGYLGLT